MLAPNNFETAFGLLHGLATDPRVLARLRPNLGPWTRGPTISCVESYTTGFLRDYRARAVGFDSGKATSSRFPYRLSYT